MKIKISECFICFILLFQVQKTKGILASFQENMIDSNDQYVFETLR